MTVVQTLQSWLYQQTWAEITGVITGLLCVYLAAKNIIWNWPFAIVNVSIYIFIFFEARLFADMGLQVYLLIMNIYGWYYWSRQAETTGKPPVIRIAKNTIIITIAGIVTATAFLGSVLRYTPASYPYLDSFCAACSLAAQVLLARKVLENWLIWIFVDVIYVVIYFFKDLHLTAAMYGIYVVLALIGYLNWKKEWQRQL